MKKLSVVISAYNEERKLPACLASVSFADEIIVIDNESSDKTVEIAKKAKAIIYTRPNNLMLNVNKNYGFTKATGDWVLNLDADERVSEALEAEIKETLKKESGHTAFEMPRKNIIFGKFIQHTGWYPDPHIRLFQKGKGRFLQEQVHEKLEVDGSVGKLTNPLIHESYETIDQFLQKTFFIYAPNEAEHLIRNGYVFSYADAIRFPLREFLGRFFAREGYRDGFHGLMLSLLMSFYHLIVFAKIWEKQKFIDKSDNVAMLFENEAVSARKQIQYWLYDKKIKQASSFLTKNLLRLKRRLSKL